MSLEIFKPTKWTIIIFVVLVILSVIFFISTNVKIFPCKTQVVYPNAPEVNDVCGLGRYFTHLDGLILKRTLPGYLVMILVFLVLPYLIACAGNYLIKRK